MVTDLVCFVVIAIVHLPFRWVVVLLAVLIPAPPLWHLVRVIAMVGFRSFKQIMILIIIVLVSAILLLTIPWLLRWVLWRAGFEQVQISYVRPFRLSNIRLAMRT